MLIRIFIFVLSFLIFITEFNSDVNAASKCSDTNGFVKNDGGCWNSITDSNKIFVVRGLWVGKQVAEEAERMIGEVPTYYTELDHSAVPEGTNIGDIINYFDKLYSFPVNRKITWKNAYLLAALNARDDDENDRISLLRFLRDYEELPTFGNIVEIKDVNHIVIKSDKGRFDINLANISVENLDDETRSKGLNLLNSLKNVSYGSCDKKRTNLGVSIEYKDQIFNKKGNLSAYINIHGNSICINGGTIPFNVIWGHSGYTHSLNSLLLSKGLAEISTTIDQKWSKDRRDLKEFNSTYSAEAASKAGLYLYGENTDPSIELISSTEKPTTY